LVDGPVDGIVDRVGNIVIECVVERIIESAVGRLLEGAIDRIIEGEVESVLESAVGDGAVKSAVGMVLSRVLLRMVLSRVLAGTALAGTVLPWTVLMRTRSRVLLGTVGLSAPTTLSPIAAGVSVDLGASVRVKGPFPLSHIVMTRE
jgi:hypothetical protein